MLLQIFTKMKKQHETMLSTFSQSLIIYSERPLLKHGPMKWTGGRGTNWAPWELNSSPHWKLWL